MVPLVLMRNPFPVESNSVVTWQRAGYDLVMAGRFLALLEPMQRQISPSQR